MGLPLFISPPSPTAKNASTNTEKAVAQHRSAIRRQRTIRSTPNWALSEIREAAASNRRAIMMSTDSDHEPAYTAHEAMLVEADAAQRRNWENRHTLRDSLSYERRTGNRELRRERRFPHAPAAPATDSGSLVRSEIPRDNARARHSYMDHYNRIHTELNQVHRGSASRSNSPPLPPYTPGFTPAHAMNSDVRSSSLRQSPERTSSSHRAAARLRSDRLGARLRRSPGYSTPPRASHGTTMSDLIAQRGHRIRARDLPDGLGDRDRSISPDNPADWDTLSVTLAPDPQAPSTANSSFASANVSTNPSTAIASATSSASDSHSSATSASDDSFHAPTYRFRLIDNSRPRVSPGIGTRSIPDFSIPGSTAEHGSASQFQIPNPELAVDASCDSGDDFDFPEPDENINSTNTNRNITNNETPSESDHNEANVEDNAEEDDLYELAESEARNPIIPGHRRSFWHSYDDVAGDRDLVGEIVARSMRHRNLADSVPMPRPLTHWDHRLPPPQSTRDRDQVSPPFRGDRSNGGNRSRAPTRNNEDNETAETDLDSETNTLGGMQRIVRMLAERRDIPDTWWAGAGLSRTANRSVVREADDDMRLEG